MDTGRSTAAAAEHGAICQVHVQDGTYKTVLITSETPDVRDIIRTVSFSFSPAPTLHTPYPSQPSIHRAYISHLACETNIKPRACVWWVQVLVKQCSERDPDDFILLLKVNGDGDAEGKRKKMLSFKFKSKKNKTKVCLARDRL